MSSTNSIAAPPAPLKDCHVAFVGRLACTGDGDPRPVKYARLTQLVRDLGGSVSANVDGRVTHLVCSRPHSALGSSRKLRLALDRQVPAVGIEWLEACEKQGARLAVDGFLLQTAPAPPHDAPAGDRKRPAQSLAPPPRAAGAPRPEAKRRKAAAGDSPAGEAGFRTPAPDSAAVAAARPPEQASQEGPLLKPNRAAVVPVDSHCPLDKSCWEVHLDESADGAYDASLNMCASTLNSNKYYYLQVLRCLGDSSSFMAWARWGRVGEQGQSALMGDGSRLTAVAKFQDKFREKTGLRWEERGRDPRPGKYAFVERNYDPDPVGDGAGAGDRAAAPGQCTLQPPVQTVMDLIFDADNLRAAMTSLNYDANKLPLGKLGKATITRGFEQLKSLAALIDDSSPAAGACRRPDHGVQERLSNAYYSLVPHDFGRSRPPVIASNALLRREVELLQSLSHMREAVELLQRTGSSGGPAPAGGGPCHEHPRDRLFRSLSLDEMTPLDPSSTEFGLLHAYLMSTRGATHGPARQYRLRHIFRVERRGEAARRVACALDRRLLWHGSRSSNFGSILSQGLRIAPPEAPRTGYMFGKGIYLADMSSKSANYCHASAAGGHALLLLCEAELGHPVLALAAAKHDAAEAAAAQGLLSAWGRGMTGPGGWTDAGAVQETLRGVWMPDVRSPCGPIGIGSSSLLYNECICYDEAQVRLRYLFHVTM